MQKTRLVLVLVAVLFALTLAGCGRAEQAKEEEEKAPEEEREEERGELQEAEEKQQKQGTPTYDIGDTHYSQVAQNESSITVHSYMAPAFSTSEFSQPQPGNQFALIDVEGCSGNTNTSLNPYDFSLQMPDNTCIQPTVALGFDPQLLHTELAPGECVRGNVVFEVPEGQQPTHVLLVPVSYPTVAKWAV